MPHIIAINEADIPEDVKEELEALGASGEGSGKLNINQLSDKTKAFLRKAKIESMSTEDNPDYLDNKIKEITAIQKATCKGIEEYIKQTDELMASFHLAELKPGLIEIYNSCAQMIRLFNELEVDHGKCLKGEENDKTH